MQKSIRIGVVVFPGSNCDQDMVDALSVYPQAEVFKLWHKDQDLQQADLIVLPGGFSYGDYLRSGAIARFSPIMKEVIDFASKGGYVLGVCNGFQILCEAKLLPGALLHNNSHQFICKNVFIRPDNQESAINASLDINQPLCIPIAHGEGRFYADEATMAEINANKQVIFRYCAADGSPSNPNGSLNEIAGICNSTKNVFGMMPHPERAADNILGNVDGRKIFDGFLKHLFALVEN
jgi:phosphoribosylformylglycinamidine synthase subunit PurQ / glutaminase